MKCATKYCRNKTVKGRTICEKCKSIKYKQNHPENYFFNVLRNNARRRGKEFLLTLSEFKSFCEQTAYMELKGQKADSLSIDRIDSSRGYHIDNIQAITLSKNSAKNNTERKFKDVPF